ncbi:MAG: hypothetical protein A2X86_08635 [Bdellovibrionales bacterium GWA2_49_15]|nr:MAG: hypothetical protein A2X86_08635 [Bdellovibrionales bacterium GWA2_49_15]HAZ11170.1 hypothetical protein [Bdellovibrionales bacterium]
MKKILALLMVMAPVFALQASSETPVCEFTKLHLAKQLKLSVECKGSYLQYCEEKGCGIQENVDKRRELKIAGFNVYNLGMEQDIKGNKLTALKDHRILAEVIGQFDLVAAIELKHFAKEDMVYNMALAKNPINGLAFRVPAYLQVLRQLQAKDSSWSLILAPDLFGINPADTLNNELSGFFYRRNVVAPVHTEYCKSLACAVPAKEFKADVARKPFLASFTSGKSTFTMAAVHFRYRYPYIGDGKKSMLNEALYNPMLKVYEFEAHTGFVYNPKVKSQVEEKYETSSRFSEVKSVSNFLGRLVANSRQKDVLLYGDFNLMAPREEEAKTPKEAAFRRAWMDEKGVLENFKGAAPYVNKLSTVGKEQLSNAFDHFVFSKSGSLKGCNTANADVFNFTDRDQFRAGDELIKSLDLEKFKQSLRTEMKLEKGKAIPRYSSGKVDFLSIGFQTKVLDSYQKGTFTVYQELISDHLPISMSCSF